MNFQREQVGVVHDADEAIPEPRARLDAFHMSWRFIQGEDAIARARIAIDNGAIIDAARDEGLAGQGGIVRVELQLARRADLNGQGLDGEMRDDDGLIAVVDDCQPLGRAVNIAAIADANFQPSGTVAQSDGEMGGLVVFGS